MKAEVVEDHIEKIQDLQSYKQHDDKISTLLFQTTNKVDTLKTCEEIIGFNDDEDVKGFNCFRVDVKFKSIEDKVRGEVFKVDEALAIENSRVSSFQVRGNHVDETKVNVVRDWPSPKIFPEVRNNKVADAFQEEDELEYAEPLNREAEQMGGSEGANIKVTEICKVPLAIGKYYNELVTCNVVDMEACVVSPKKKLESKILVTLVASPKEFQAERKKTGVSYALVVKGIEDVIENAISAVVKPLLAEFGKTVADDTPVTFPPLRNIQHQIDLSRKTTLLVSISNEVLGFDSIKKLYASDEDFGNIWMELETKQHRGLNGHQILTYLVKSQYYRMAGDYWKRTWGGVLVVPLDEGKKGCQMRLNSSSIYSVKKFNPYARYSVKHWKNPHVKIFTYKESLGKPKEEVYSNSKIVQVIKTYWELGHDHKFITEIVARRANDCIVSITKPDYKNLNKNDIEDIYLLVMNGKVPDYADTRLLWSLSVFIRSTVIWERVHDFQLGIESYQQKVNLTAPTMTFLGIKDHEMFSIIYELVHGIIYKNSKKEKRVMRHSEIHKFCDATLNRVLEGLKSYNNDVKYGYVQKDLTKDETEYLKLFEEEIDERLKHRRQMRRWEMFVNGRPLRSRRECPE
ncbi:hypothetical protein Tco_0286010 [Tanacetum coccineum]